MKFEEGYYITPSNLPNKGILFVDHAANNRSGHLGHALVQCENGDILAFYPNCSVIRQWDGWNISVPEILEKPGSHL